MEVDILVLAVMFVVSTLAAGFVGWFSGKLAITARFEDLQEMVRELKSAGMGVKSAMGVSAKQQNQEELEAAMGEAVLMLKEGKKPDEILKTLLPKYPQVALRLAKRFGLNL